MSIGIDAWEWSMPEDSNHLVTILNNRIQKVESERMTHKKKCSHKHIIGYSTHTHVLWVWRNTTKYWAKCYDCNYLKEVSRDFYLRAEKAGCFYVPSASDDEAYY